MKKNLFASSFFILFFFTNSCGENNIFDCEKTSPLSAQTKSQCSSKTPDEKAVIALNAGDLETAQTILEDLIAKNPTEYFRYPRLAVVYATQGGFDLLNISQLSGGSGAGIQDAIGEFLPSPKTTTKEEYDGYVNKIADAKNLLLEMPAAERTRSEEYYYGASAELQLTLYLSAFSIMYMNKFAASPENLADLTIDDAIIIISSLKDAALNSGQTSPETAAKIQDLLDKIDSSEGTDDKEKLEAFLKAKKK